MGIDLYMTIKNIDESQKYACHLNIKTLFSKKKVKISVKIIFCLSRDNNDELSKTNIPSRVHNNF